MKEYRSIAPTLFCAALLLPSLMACGGDRDGMAMQQETVADASPSVPTGPEAASTAEKAAVSITSPHPMMPGRIYAPTTGEIACPSQAFEPFLHAFFSSGDLQVRYTARPYVLKGPYYLKHNTQPGDPTNPQWETVEIDIPIHDRYRYDARLQAYISDSSRLRPGQRWTGIDADGQHIVRPIAELQVRKVSETEYAIDTPGRITTFTRREDCWYLTHDWSLDPFEGCQWPDECQAMREYEAPYYDEGD